jgi:hypothetical protein
MKIAGELGAEGWVANGAGFCTEQGEAEAELDSPPHFAPMVPPCPTGTSSEERPKHWLPPEVCGLVAFCFKKSENRGPSTGANEPIARNFLAIFWLDDNSVGLAIEGCIAQEAIASESRSTI